MSFPSFYNADLSPITILYQQNWIKNGYISGTESAEFTVTIVDLCSSLDISQITAMGVQDIKKYVLDPLTYKGDTDEPFTDLEFTTGAFTVTGYPEAATGYDTVCGNVVAELVTDPPFAEGRSPIVWDPVAK